MRSRLVPFVAATLFCCGLARAADEAPKQPSEDRWTFTVAPYAWAAGIKGTVGQFGLPPIEVDASFADVLKHFDIGAMGAAEARYGRFGIATDLQYIRVSTDANTPAGLIADHVEVTSKTLSLFGAAMWRAVDTDEASVDLMAGARLWSVNTKVDPVGGPLGFTEFSDGDTWVDPVIGAKARLNLQNDIYLTGWGMVGGFGAASRITWDVMGAVGYEVTETTSLIAGYRALGVDYQNGDFLFDVVESGPILGALVRF